MSDPDEFFNDPSLPQRPDHPDYWRMAEILQQMDANVTEAIGGDPTAYDDEVKKTVDYETISYVAIQRGMRILGIKTRGELMTHAPEVMRFAAIYIEAFIVGARFQDRGGKQEKA